MQPARVKANLETALPPRVVEFLSADEQLRAEIADHAVSLADL